MNFCQCPHALVRGLLAVVAALASTLGSTPASADWEQQILTSKNGRPLFNMVTKGDLVMGPKFAGVSLYLQCFNGETLITIYAVEPYFTVTPITVRYWLDTASHPPEQWTVAEGRNSIGVGFDSAKSLMRALIGHERLRLYIPVQDGGFGFATFALGRVKPAVEAVAARCGWQL